jgi:hypothetical protein
MVALWREIECVTSVNKADSLKIAQNVKAAISKFHYFLKKAGASDEECKKILMRAS